MAVTLLNRCGTPTLLLSFDSDFQTLDSTNVISDAEVVANFFVWECPWVDPPADGGWCYPMASTPSPGAVALTAEYFFPNLIRTGIWDVTLSVELGDVVTFRDLFGRDILPGECWNDLLVRGGITGGIAPGPGSEDWDVPVDFYDLLEGDSGIGCFDGTLLTVTKRIHLDGYESWSPCRCGGGLQVATFLRLSGSGSRVRVTGSWISDDP